MLPVFVGVLVADGADDFCVLLAAFAAAALLWASIASWLAAAALLSICDGGVPPSVRASLLPTLFAFVWLVTGGVCAEAADCVSTVLAPLIGSLGPVELTAVDCPAMAPLAPPEAAGSGVPEFAIPPEGAAPPWSHWSAIFPAF